MSAPFPLRTADRLELLGEVWGQGPRRMTFVHGAGLPVQTYAPAFAPLAADLTVLALNSRGHGGSDVPSAFPSYAAPEADLAALAAWPPGPPLLLGGHSFGALISLSLAARCPELVSGLLLLDPLVPWPRGQDWPRVGEGSAAGLIERTRARRERWPTREAAGLWLRERGIYSSWHESAFRAFLEHGLTEEGASGVRLACPPWLEASLYTNRPDRAVFEWAEQVRVPVVIVRGHGSRECSAEGARDLADALALGAVFTVRGGHTFPQEFPAETAGALRMAVAALIRPVQEGPAADPKDPEPRTPRG